MSHVKVGFPEKKHTQTNATVMARKSSQRLKSCAQFRPAGILATTATVVFGAVVYNFFTTGRAKNAGLHRTHAPLTDDTIPTKSAAGKPTGRMRTTAKDASGNSTYTKWDDNWDSRNPNHLVKRPSGEEPDSEVYRETLKKRTPRASRHLILIRHGSFTRIHTHDRHRTLTSLGQEQSEMTGQYLRDLGLKYTGVVSSTMSRAAETADIIHKFLPWLKLERDVLLSEGRPVIPEPYLSWKPDHVYFQDGPRIEAAFRKYFHRADPEQVSDSVEILVCHANIIRYFVCRALQFPPEAWGRIALPHGSVTHVIIRPSGNVYLMGLGNVGHMPPSKVTVTSRC